MYRIFQPNLSTIWSHWPTTMSHQATWHTESHSTNAEFPTSKMIGLDDFYRIFFGMTKSGRKLAEDFNKNIPTVSWCLNKSLATHLACIKIIKLRKWWDQLSTSTGARFRKRHQALKKLREGFPIRPERVSPSPFCHVGGWCNFKHVYIILEGPPRYKECR